MAPSASGWRDPGFPLLGAGWGWRGRCSPHSLSTLISRVGEKSVDAFWLEAWLLNLPKVALVRCPKTGLSLARHSPHSQAA